MRTGLLLFLLVGCAVDPCAQFEGQTCIAVEVRGSFSVDQFLISATGAFVLSDEPSPQQPRVDPVPLPVTFAVLAGDASGNATLIVRARLGGNEVGSGIAAVVVERNKSITQVINLTGPSELPDLAASDLSMRAVDLAGIDLAGVQCDVTTQLPCAAGSKCIFENGKPVCRPDGPNLVAQSCTTDPLDDCARGTQCLFPGNLLPGDGICEQFCAKEADCTQPSVPVGGLALPNNRAHCLFRFTTPGPINLCSVACNPVATRGASGCPSGAGCVYGTDGNFPEYTFCDRAATGVDGEACSASFRCAEGFNCMSVGGSFRCRAMCRANTDTDCPAQRVCTPGAGGTPPMFGYCCPSGGC
jgi:hypothetical protein